MVEAEHIFDTIVRSCILLIELAGIIIIVISMVRGFIGYLRRQDSTRIQLAQGIMLGLEFKIGSEVLRTLIVREWNELAILGAIVLLRAAITFLIQWEIKNEKKQLSAQSV